MDQAELALRWFQTIIWPPAVIVGLAVLFRREIAELTRRLTKVGVSGGPYAEMTPPQTQVDIAEAPSSASDEVMAKAMQEVETKADQAQEEAVARGEEANLYLAYYWYERLYRLIFGSQIRLLDYMNSRPGSTNVVELKPFHEEHLGQMRALNPQYTYDLNAYLAFLQSSWLIATADGIQYALTDFGRGFLHYLIDGALPRWKPY